MQLLHVTVTIVDRPTATVSPGLSTAHLYIHTDGHTDPPGRPVEVALARTGGLLFAVVRVAERVGADQLAAAPREQADLQVRHKRVEGDTFFHGRSLTRGRTPFTYFFVGRNMAPGFVRVQPDSANAAE